MKKVKEQELKEYAQEQSKAIAIRSYNRGNSSDTIRATTEYESKIIEAVIFGALLAIRSGYDQQGAKASAEYIGDLLLPEMNGYLTIYLPICGFEESEQEAAQ